MLRFQSAPARTPTSSASRWLPPAVSVSFAVRGVRSNAASRIAQRLSEHLPDEDYTPQSGAGACSGCGPPPMSGDPESPAPAADCVRARELTSGGRRAAADGSGGAGEDGGGVARGGCARPPS
eukprot:1132445-Rhodomonas_salina.1